MMKRRNTRELLVEEGVTAFLARGYEGVGIQQILAGVGVPKGSFYNHFASKEDFAREVIDAYERRYEIFVTDCFSGDVAPLERLRVYFARLEEQMREAGASAGCLYGVLSQTSAPHSEVLRGCLKQAFARWRANLIKLLEAARAAGDLTFVMDIGSLADAIIDSYEGALVRMRAEGSIAPVSRFRAVTLERLLGNAG